MKVDCRIEVLANPPCQHLATPGSPAGIRSTFLAFRLEVYCKVEGCIAFVELGNIGLSFCPDVATTDPEDDKPKLTLVP